MTVAHLSQNFAVREVFGQHEPTEAERWLAEVLCKQAAEAIRRVVGCPLHVTDGYRTWESFNLLKQKGYKPYRWSDHSFLQEWNPLGVGALDLVKLRTTRVRNRAREAFTEQEYHQIVDRLDPQWYGQLIWYRQKGHIHVSNPRTLWFSEAALEHGGFPAYRAATYIKEG